MIRHFLFCQQKDSIMEYIPSPNFTRGRHTYRPIAIVVHIMQGSLSGTDSWFGDPKSQVSAHYGIGKSGDIHRYVLETDSAWHAGRVNDPSWDLLITAGNGYVVNPNYYTIGIEHEGDENSEWTDEMYASSTALIADIARRWNIPLDRKHIIGHHEIYSIKTCPGNKVSFDKLISMALQVNFNVAPVSFKIVTETGQLLTICKLNIRKTPSIAEPPIKTVEAGTSLNYIAYTLAGESLSGESKWYMDPDGYWFWDGAVIASKND